MYLKTLEITGFKSFPEKTRVEFSPGITAAIGPNGCGKSNLVDAVRWVLGEQSARLLRGAKMDDLIFNGTVRRKALNFAEVSLTFDRADQFLPTEYQEVLITRRMYRTGEGEYYLNRTACRLKDITGLFLDTGIGREAYSLIGQGRVEQLINARPEENRELFEEAAEIHKYKLRKKEAAVRLEEMNKNLLRVEDILAELQNQSAPLSEAAVLARQYRAFSAALQETEKMLLLQRRQKNYDRQQRVAAELDRLDRLLQEKQGLLTVLGEQTNMAAQQESLKLAEINEIKELFQEEKAKLEKLQSRVNLAAEQKKYSVEKIAIKAESAREVQGRIEGLQETCGKNEAALKGVLQEQQQLGEKASGLQVQRQKIQNKSSLAALETLRQQETENNLQKAARGQLLESIKGRCQELSEGIKENAARRKVKEAELALWQKDENALLANRQRLEWDGRDLDQERALLEQRRNEISGQKKACRDKLVNLEREWQKKSARLKYLKETEDALSLYARGVRAVMNQYARGAAEKGIYGPVAGLIHVSPEFERALEVALGAKMQFIVTSDAHAAQKAIAFLKEKKAGRATFLPLTLVKPSAGKKFPAAEQDDICGVATKLVETPAHFKKVVEYLLGGVLVAKNLEAALRLASVNKAGWRIVTLEGEMITPGGAISGGYQAEEHSGFLQRKRELKNLEIETQEMQKISKEKSRELETAESSLGELEKSLARLDQKGKKLAEEKAKAQRELDRVAAEKGRAQQEINQLTLAGQGLAEKQHALAAQAGETEKDYQALNVSLEKINLELKNLSRQVAADAERYKSLEKELVEIRVRFSALQEKESALQEVLHRQLQEKRQLEEIYARLLTEKEKLQAELKEAEAEAAVTAAAQENSAAKVKELKHFQEKLLADFNDYQQARAELSAEMEKEQKTLEKAERRRQNVNIELVKWQEATKYLEESLLEKFNISPGETFCDASVAVKAEEVLLEDKALLEEKIRLLGEVDPGADDEYVRIQNRISFLEGQRADLQSGGTGIKKVLQELDRNMEKKFLQALQAIENNFTDIFAQLFGGGLALLKPTDAENMLESGIEIIAQPPGKKLQNISLLSGGEKALTAIALLFALLKYKPVPFCVLDEIDSSLDESNLAKFVHFLKRFAADTQFVVITHRRKTMEESDVLYGVTMEEQGVSKVVSLDLKQKAG